MTSTIFGLDHQGGWTTAPKNPQKLLLRKPYYASMAMIAKLPVSSIVCTTVMQSSGTRAQVMMARLLISSALKGSLKEPWETWKLVENNTLSCAEPPSHPHSTLAQSLQTRACHVLRSQGAECPRTLSSLGVGTCWNCASEALSSRRADKGFLHQLGKHVLIKGQAEGLDLRARETARSSPSAGTSCLLALWTYAFPIFWNKDRCLALRVCKALE